MLLHSGNADGFLGPIVNTALPSRAASPASGARNKYQDEPLVGITVVGVGKGEIIADGPCDGVLRSKDSLAFGQGALVQ